MKIFLFLLILAGAGSYGYYWKYYQQNKTEEKPIIPTEEVERGPISLLVSSTGRVVSSFDVELKCKASGQIILLPFDVSDTVKQGELLIELDPVDEKRRVNQAEVTLMSSQARLNQAQINLKMAKNQLHIDKERAESNFKSAQAKYLDAKAKSMRLEKLWKEKLTSEEERTNAITSETQFKADLENAEIRLRELEVEALSIDLKQQDIALAEVQVELDKINLSEAQERVNDTKVFSPITGVVANREVQIGQIISSGISNVGGGTAVITLSDLSHLYILASVDESEIGKVDVGQKVTITADAFSSRRFEGKVVRIATRGLNASNVVTFEVKIEVLQRGKPVLKPEMTANVSIIISEKEDALMVPTEAIYNQPKQQFASKKEEISEPSDSNTTSEGKKPHTTEKPVEKDPTKEEPELKKEDPLKTENKTIDSPPSTALKKRDRFRKPTYYLMVMKPDGNTEEREVEIGINDGVRVEIVKGVEEKEHVVINKADAQSRWRQGGRGMNPMRFRGRRR